MPKNPLLEDIDKGRTSIGVWANSADMIELCAAVGFHWVMIDQMFTSIDWSTAAELIRAAEASDITPVLRIQSNPWLGYDHRLAVDVSRAMGIGAQFMLVSNSGKEDMDECLAAGRDWHRKALTIHPYRDFDEWEPTLAHQSRQTFVIPQPETKGGLEYLEEVMTNPDCKVVFIAMTDASRVLSGSHRPDFNHPKLWEYVDRAVELGRQTGVTVGANTSYAYTMEAMVDRVRQLHEHGVRMIMAQGANFLFQIAANRFLSDVRSIIES